MSSPAGYQHHHSPAFSPSPSVSSSLLTTAAGAAAATTTTSAATLTSPHLTAVGLTLADGRTSSNSSGSGSGKHYTIPRSHAILPSYSPSLSSSPSSPHPRGIRKKASSRHRSASYVDRLRHVALDSFTADSSLYCDQTVDEPTSNALQQWYTPQHSPQTSSLLFPDSDLSLVDSASSYQSWSVPTPPHSDSGIPSVSADDQASIACASVSTAADFAFDDVVASVEMSSLGYLLPGQYANGIAQASTDQYDMDTHRAHSVTTSSSPYSHAASSSPSLYQGRIAPQYPDGRHSGSAPNSVYAPAHGGRRLMEPYDSPAASDYSAPSASQHTIPSLSGLAGSVPASVVGSPDMGAMPQHYASHVPRHSGMYESSYYPQGYSTAPSHTSMYAPQHGAPSYPSMPYNSSDQMSRASSSDMSTRTQSQRPKAQCWEHGCNGRQFSTFSNLLRHQREKSGTATKSYCPKCGAEFTRTTARNGHLLHDKCTKTRRPSEER